MIFFSVIIPTYNQANLLERCLKSVTQQTFKNYEVIIVDNYSTDNTSKVVKKFGKKIKYFKIRNRGVIAKSRNLGIKKSKGKWICFLDSDDTWVSYKLKKLFMVQKQFPLDIICNAEWILKGKNKKLWVYGPDDKNFYLKMILKGNRFSTSGTSVKKSFLKKNKLFFSEKKSFVTCEDYDFFLKIAKFKCNKKFINEPLGSHFFHSSSTSSNYKRHRKAFISVLKFHFSGNNFLKKNFSIKNIVFRYDFKFLCSNFFSFKSFIKNIIEFLKTFSQNPIRSTILLLEFSLIKLKNIFFYLKFRGL